MHWDDVIEEIGPPLLRFFAASFRRERAAELVQDTLIRVVNKVETGAFDEARGSLLKFAYGIARYVRLESLKSLPQENRSDQILDIDSESNPLEDAYDNRLKIERLRRAIGQLSTIQQEVITLFLSDDLTLNDISEMLALPVGTVKSHMHRAKERLTEIMLEREK